jgi:hypothetical protein
MHFLLLTLFDYGGGIINPAIHGGDTNGDKSYNGMYVDNIQWDRLWLLLPFWALGALVLWWLIRKKRR